MQLWHRRRLLNRASVTSRRESAIAPKGKKWSVRVGSKSNHVSDLIAVSLDLMLSNRSRLQAG
jgi:hypothetical protein